jgi:HlyD family secretion protein
MKVLIGVVLLAAVVLGVLGLGFWEFGGGDGAAYRTAALTRGDLLVAVGASGTIEPEEIVDVGAQVVGRIRHFGTAPHDPGKTIDYGTLVEEGTVLAQIDETMYKALVEQADADLKRAQAEMVRYQAQMVRAKADWDRAQELKDSIPTSDYDRFEAEFEMAKANLQVGDAGIMQAEAALKQARANLDFTTIKSPIRGIVLDRRVNVGQTVVAGLNAPSLFLLAKDLGRLEIWASINEADISSVRQGQPVQFTVDAYPGTTFHGTVMQIRLNASMTQNVVTYTVVVGTSNPDGKLLPYMTANLRFEVARRDGALLVPNQALHWRPSPRQMAPEAKKDALGGQSPGAADLPGSTADAGTPGKPGTLWVEAGDGLVRPVAVRVGLSDGVMSELLQTDLTPQTKVVVGQAQTAENEADFVSTFLRLNTKGE